MMIDDDVMIGIVTLNRRGKLIRTLEECYRLGFTKLLVVDNGSSDGTREYLQQQTSIQHIFTETNEGGSGGFNRVMRHFIENTSCRWLLTFDDDAYPTFTYQSLIDYLCYNKDAEWPGCAFRVTYPDGSLCEMNRPGTNVLARSPLWYFVSDFHISEDTPRCFVDFAGFVGLVLKRETIQAVGIVSKEFFIYSDDTYYTLSISRKSGQLLYCPEFVFIHDCKHSTRNFINHDQTRLERDVVNKTVLIREYSRFPVIYLVLYVMRLLFINPRLSVRILIAFRKGMTTNPMLYKNEVL